MQIHIDSCNEYLLQVKGTSGIVDGSPTITSLMIITNKTTYGPYGCIQGKRFQSSPTGKVVGFFGQASKILNQLGVITMIYVAPYNKQCNRCKMPYVYSCYCTVKNSNVQKDFSRRKANQQLYHDNPIISQQQKQGQHTTTKFQTKQKHEPYSKSINKKPSQDITMNNYIGTSTKPKHEVTKNHEIEDQTYNTNNILLKDERKNPLQNEKSIHKTNNFNIHHQHINLPNQEVTTMLNLNLYQLQSIN